MSVSNHDFWIPKYKYELVKWLGRHYETDRFGQKIDWNKFPKNRLMAIYVSKRSRYENPKKEKKTRVGKAKKTPIPQEAQVDFL